jgi:hypothetical protein
MIEFTKVKLDNYEVWALTDKISTLPVFLDNVYLDIKDNGMTIIRDEQRNIVAVLNGSYSIFRKELP